MSTLIPPYGGALTNLVAEGTRHTELLHEASSLPALHLNPRQLCDLELLLNGALSPLHAYLGEAEWQSVLENMRLADGTFWPMPVVLDVAEALPPGGRYLLKDGHGESCAILTVSECWQPDKTHEARLVYGSDQPDHTGMTYLQELGDFYVGGTLEGLQLPTHADFAEERQGPAHRRAQLAQLGFDHVVAFQPYGVMHRAQFEFTLHAAQEHHAALLIQAMADTQPDADFFTRVRCGLALHRHYPEKLAQFSLLAFSPRPAGAREVLLRAIVARNHGCSHFIIGGDAGPGEIRRGSDALKPEHLPSLAEHFATLGMEAIVFPRMVYVPNMAQFMPEDYLPPGLATLSLSSHEIRERIADGRETIPAWASFPEVVAELHKRYPPRLRRGFTVFFTGLSGAGKTTLSQALELRLTELTGRPVTLLDGDVVRTLLSSGLSYSRADRDLNIRRIGFVAAEVTRHGGIAICAPIAPYRATRQAVRDMIEPLGGFFEVHVATPLEVCEARDPKGLYAKARAGVIKEFTGVSDPYEAPHAPEVSIDTGTTHVSAAIEQIVAVLRQEGYLIAT